MTRRHAIPTLTLAAAALGAAVLLASDTPVFARGPAADAVSVVFVLDTSASVQQGRLERGHRVAPAPENFDQLVSAARLVLGELRPDDEAALVTFADRISLVAPFAAGGGTVGQGMASAALRQPPRAFPASVVHDAVIAAAGLVAARGRPAHVLLLSDGVDTSSWASQPEAINAARAFGVEVDFVTVPRTYETYDDVDSVYPVDVDPLAKKTGGRVLSARDGRLATKIRDLVEGWRAAALSRTAR
ncbi:MAG: vWA domain-containing protein [Vicinamibacterales bacterium]